MKLSFDTFNVIYILESQKDKCISQYFGTTPRQLNHRIADHKDFILYQILSKAAGADIICQTTLADNNIVNSWPEQIK